MDKKKTAIRAGAVLVVALAAGHLVQTMSEGRATAEAAKPTAVQSVSAGAEGGTQVIPMAASLTAPVAASTTAMPETASITADEGAMPEAVMPETALPDVVFAEPEIAPELSEDTPTPVALPDVGAVPMLDADPMMPELAPETDAMSDDYAAPAPLATEPETAVVAGGDCSTDMVLTADPQAMIAVSIFAPCRAGERVVLRHGGVAVAEILTEDGSLQLDFPALDMGGELSVLFPDATVLRDAVAMAGTENRFVVQWMGDDAFQLHAFENGADYGQPEDVNAEQPVSPNGGYLMALGNPDLDFPMMAQVYTWPADAAIPVDLVIEAAVTDLTCDRELLGEVVKAVDGTRSVNDLTLAMPDCDAVGDILVLNNPGQDVTLSASN